jgi:transcriptional regulator of nitric oxide reductase
VQNRALAIAVLTCAAGIGVIAGQRVLVNPRPDAHLKTLFPTAVAFSPKAGEPPVFKAYAVDPATNPSAVPLGYAFWTPELVPDEKGYEGPIHLLVGLDRNARLTGVVVDYHTEPYGYFSVEPPAFAQQFKGKSLRDPFQVGQDIAAVSRASLTIAGAVRAIRDSALLVERAYLTPPVKPPR